MSEETEEKKEQAPEQNAPDTAPQPPEEAVEDKPARHRKNRKEQGEEKKKTGWWGRVKQLLLLGDNESEDPEELDLRDLMNQMTWRWVMRQVPLLMAFFLFGVLSITARYATEEKQIRINALQKDVTDYRYRALTRSSQLTERTRQSRIEERLKTLGDSTLLPSSEAPFLIRRER